MHGRNAILGSDIHGIGIGIAHYLICHVAGQAVRIVYLLIVCPNPIAIIQVQPIVRPQPYYSLHILIDGCDGIVRKSMVDSQMPERDALGFTSETNRTQHEYT